MKNLNLNEIETVSGGDGHRCHCYDSQNGLIQFDTANYVMTNTNNECSIRCCAMPNSYKWRWGSNVAQGSCQWSCSIM